MALQLLPMFHSRRPWLLSTPSFDPFDLSSEMDDAFSWGPLLPSRRNRLNRLRSRHPMKKDPQKWKELIEVPEMFSPDDVHVQEDGSFITIKATKDDEGCHGHMVHKVSIPRDVDRESLKTLWLNNDHALVLMGQRKNNAIKHDSPKAIRNDQPQEGVVAKKEQAKEQSDDSEDDWEMFPSLSTFFAEPFGYPSMFYPVRGRKRKMKRDENEKAQPIKKAPAPQVESTTAQSPTTEEPAKPDEKKEEEVTIVIDGKDKEVEKEKEEEPLAKPFRLHVDVTGYLQDDVKVDVNERQVTVNGEHKEDLEERCFSRKFTLPDFVDAAQVKWNWDAPNSELVITAPLL
jgi:HSP20 family molecular chaperone IbpA